MKLLIVEDERMTREGLLKTCDWPALGVSKVFSAESGEMGLAMARRILPDIVLTDIRMPRIDGITMVSRIREFLPECRVVFLSAYSEIDYYKAAIDLKAMRYLDKPIEADRLRTVIAEAVSECRQLCDYKTTRAFHHRQERQKFADAICAGEDAPALESAYSRLGLREVFRIRDYCMALTVSLMDFDENVEDLLALAGALSEAVAVPNLYTARRKNRIVLFLFAHAELSEYQIAAACKKLQIVLDDRVYSITVGKQVRGLGHAAMSYTAAKAAMDKAYLYPRGQIVYYSDETEKAARADSYAREKSEILRNLQEGAESEALLACENLYRALTGRRNLKYDRAFELYCEIIYEVFHQAEVMHLPINGDDSEETVSWIVRIENFNLSELHHFLCGCISRHYASLEESMNEKKQVLAIKNYIAKHFMNNNLSIGEISGYVRMSASHVCTMFKKETGGTINNHITEVRLGKAREYLKESLLSVSEIGAKVGYSDNSYFGRIFRKHFGITPNDYRNQ